MTGPDPENDEGRTQQGEVKRIHTCRCPLCGYEMPEPPATPCYALKCPRCESVLSGRPW